MLGQAVGAEKVNVVPAIRKVSDDGRRLRTSDLMSHFEEVRRAEQLDETAAEVTRRAYV